MRLKGPTLRRTRGQNARKLHLPRGSNAGEGGYVLLAVLFMVAMVLIILSIAAPKMAADIERDREVELVHRGQQYVRAIKLYYKKFGAYPPNLDALEKTNEIRFLRKRYKDPVTGKDEWHLIHFGENKTPSYGFFGQPLGGTGGSTLAGVGPGGVGQNIGQNIGGSSSQSAFGSSSAGGGLFGGSSFGGNSNSGTSTGTIGATGTTATTGTDPNAGTAAGNAGGTAGATTTGTGTATDPTAGSGTPGTGTPGSGSTGTIGGSTNGQTFGGGGIIGVESTSPKLAILEWKKKKHFNEWEFWYDPNADRMMVSNNAGAIGQPAGGAPGSNGTSGSFGSGGSTFGNGGSFGSGGTGVSSPTPTPTPTPTQPQQPQQ
jgi:type II secretory pathway pseudopilin PulG